MGVRTEWAGETAERTDETAKRTETAKRMGRMPRGSVPRLIDVVLALGTAAIVATAATQAREPGSRPSEWAGWGLALAVAALLMVRRRYPVAVLIGLTGVIIAYNMVGFAGIGFVWPLLVGLYTAAEAGRLPVAVMVAVGAIMLDTGWLLVAERHPVLPVLGMSVPDAVVAGLAIALGDAVRSRRRWAAETRERLRRVSLEKDRQARQAIIEQRLRIAREIHDVTAHTLAVVTVQINVAADALPAEPAAAERALDAARTVSQQAMNELRTAVRILRAPGGVGGGGGDADEPQEPLPGLTDLPDLIDGYGAEPRIRLRESGPPPQVPATVGLTVYRIVQEALTNVIKHAGAAANVEVTVDYDADSLVVRVTDDGGGNGAEEIAPPGNGLLGLAERAAGIGGTLESGPTPEGGFTVRARIPIGADSLTGGT